MTNPLPRVDPLGEALHFLRLSATVYCRSEFTAPWALELPPMAGFLMFHVVVSGQCWLEAPGTAPRLLQPGELALVPHGAGHRLSSDPDIPGPGLFDLPREHVSERYEILRYGGGGALTHIVCGAMRFDHPAAYHLLQLLPKTIVFIPGNAPETVWLDATLRIMAAEARELRPGGEAVITRLADVLVIQAIRSWIQDAPTAWTGWLGALRDRQIGKAITLIHRDPTHPWTVAELAAAVAMSRSAFSARFNHLVGEPAMKYVTRWRMYLALTWLKENASVLGEIADRLGYQSEAAFSRAFKRVIGVSPGAVKTTTRPADIEGTITASSRQAGAAASTDTEPLGYG